MSKVFAFLGLTVGLVALADVLTHPSGTAAAANGVASILTPTYNAILGGSNTGGK